MNPPLPVDKIVACPHCAEPNNASAGMCWLCLRPMFDRPGAIQDDEFAEVGEPPDSLSRFAADSSRVSLEPNRATDREQSLVSLSKTALGVLVGGIALFGAIKAATFFNGKGPGSAASTIFLMILIACWASPSWYKCFWTRHADGSEQVRTLRFYFGLSSLFVLIVVAMIGAFFLAGRIGDDISTLFVTQIFGRSIVPAMGPTPGSALGKLMADAGTIMMGVWMILYSIVWHRP